MEHDDGAATISKINLPRPTNIAKAVFYNNTWKETEEYLASDEGISGGWKCVYGSPVVFKPEISMGETLLVFEMNNQTNQLMGFGIIKNLVSYDRKYRIYTGLNAYMNFNIYKGRYRVSREEFLTYQGILDETGKTAEQLLADTEKMLFCGRTHHKRGVGIRIMSDARMPKTIKSQFYRVVLDILASKVQMPAAETA